MCRGVFGSHVAMVLRRLRRLVAHYGGDPRWCLASATVGNPGELATRLTGLEFDEVVEDASPRGREAVRAVEPADPRRGDRAPAERPHRGGRARWRARRQDASARSGSRGRGGRPSCSRSSRAATWATRRSATRIKSYRAGYLAEDRRKIERQLADGELLAVASTNALELGIDIGSLDAAVLTGYPGTRASMWQQAGRAGRRDADSLAILVAQDDPLDQYLVHHPEDLFDKPAEAAVIDPTNPYVLEPHLRCAARGAAAARRGARVLRRRGDVARPRSSAWWSAASWSARATPGTTAGRSRRTARSTSGPGGGHVYSIVIGETGELLGTADERRAYATLHPGAVYLHQGEQYLVRRARPGGARRGRARGRPGLLHAGARHHRHRGGRRRSTEGATGDVDAFFGTVARHEPGRRAT